MVLDRYTALPIFLSLSIVVAAVAGWGFGMVRGKMGWSFPLLLLACAAGGAAWHHCRRDIYAADNIGNFAPAAGRPVQLRGVVEEEPIPTAAQPASALLSMDRPASATCVLRVTALRARDNWRPASGHSAVDRRRAASTLACWRRHRSGGAAVYD